MSEAKQYPAGEDPARRYAVESWPLGRLCENSENYRRHPLGQRERLQESLRRFGIFKNIVARPDGTILCGHGLVAAARAEGLPEVPVHVFAGTDEEARALMVADNELSALAVDDDAQLSRLLLSLRDTDLLAVSGHDEGSLNALLREVATEQPASGIGQPGAEGARRSLAERFGVPPFSVLDARQGYWQERKRAWLALGIQSELGRLADAVGDRRLLLPRSADSGFYRAKRAAEAAAGRALSTREFDAVYEPRGAGNQGVSVFDPVLCELAYRWFCPPGGRVLDPFAGGSVRGIVAALLARDYTGIDLRPEQVAANERQADRLCDLPGPSWVIGDARLVKQLAPGEYDFLFSCPPYFDLEVYSDDRADLSNASDYGAFQEAYCQVIADCVSLLKPDRFACFVVGDVRDTRGNYRDFVGDTVAAFREAGAHLYNEAVLITAGGGLPVRAGRAFQASRKLGKTHQNVLVFVKGCGKRAASAVGEVDFGDGQGQLSRG